MLHVPIRDRYWKERLLHLPGQDRYCQERPAFPVSDLEDRGILKRIVCMENDSDSY
jgi:hypothetical protein